jgi:heavy metal sensor kinase
VKPLTLRTTLTLAFTGVLALLLAAVGVIYYHALALQLDADATSEVAELTSAMHAFLRFDHGVPALAYDRNDPDEVAFVERAARYYQIFDAESGRLVLQAPALAPLGLHFTPSEVAGFRERSRSADMWTDQGRIRFSNSLITAASGEVYLLQVGVRMDVFDRARDRFLRLLLWSLPACVFVAIVAGRWMAGRALAPLARLAAASHTIDVTDLGRRLPLRGANDELDEVARAFNETLGRLEHAVGDMKQFSTALAHELRTPLAALRGEIELALRRPGLDDQQRSGFGSQLEELDRLKRLIDQILTLARAEAGQIQLSFAPVDLGELGVALVEQLEPVAQGLGIDLRCDRSGPVFVEGDAGWLRRLLLNLLDNALKFTGEGGHVALRLTNVKEEVRMDVRDTGIGMAADVTPRIFDRFFRADPSRSSALDGAGLGLSLVKWIAERHHGRVMVESATGEGSTFTVWLPRTHGTRAVPRQMIAS